MSGTNEVSSRAARQNGKTLSQQARYLNSPHLILTSRSVRVALDAQILGISTGRRYHESNPTSLFRQ